MLKSLATLGAFALLVPFGASAATTTFFDEAGRADFTNLLSGFSIVETFDVEADGAIPAGGRTLAGSGITITPSSASADNLIDGGALRLSTDSANGANPAANATRSITLALPNLSQLFGTDFGNPGGNNRGIGNDSGTTLELLLGTVVVGSYDFSTMFGTDPGYIGFFGISSDDAFDAVRFVTNNAGAFTDDDFQLDTVLFSDAAPIPLPAGLPLLIAGLGALGIVRARRNA
jgi:hypothetical protein